MKLYWRVKHNGKWTWRPAKTEIVQVPFGNNGAIEGRLVVITEEE